MSRVRPDRIRVPLVAAAVVCALVAIAAYWLSGESGAGEVVGEFVVYDAGRSDGHRASPDRHDTEDGVGGRAAAGEPPDRTTRPRDASTPSSRVARETGAHRGAPEDELETHSDESADPSDLPTSTSTSGEGDVGPRGPDDAGGQRDTPRHLGPRRWMAEVPEAERETLRREIERDVGPLYDIAREDRRRAVERVDAIAASCLERHLQGSAPKNARMVVEFVLVVDGGAAAVEEPLVRDVVGLEHPAFVSCLRDGLTDIRFDGGRDGRRQVEYPLFLGDRDGAIPTPSSTP